MALQRLDAVFGVSHLALLPGGPAARHLPEGVPRSTGMGKVVFGASIHYPDVPALRRDLDGQRAAGRGPGSGPGHWIGPHATFTTRSPAVIRPSWTTLA